MAPNDCPLKALCHKHSGVLQASKKFFCSFEVALALPTWWYTANNAHSSLAHFTWFYHSGQCSSFRGVFNTCNMMHTCKISGQSLDKQHTVLSSQWQAHSLRPIPAVLQLLHAQMPAVFTKMLPQIGPDTRIPPPLCLTAVTPTALAAKPIPKQQHRACPNQQHRTPPLNSTVCKSWLVFDGNAWLRLYGVAWLRLDVSACCCCCCCWR